MLKEKKKGESLDTENQNVRKMSNQQLENSSKSIQKQYNSIRKLNKNVLEELPK